MWLIRETITATTYFMTKNLLFKTLFLIAVLVFGVSINRTFAQSSGNEDIDRFLILSKEYYEASDYDKAELSAQSAFELSRKKGNFLGMGKSLQSEALALIGNDKKVKYNRKKAIQKLNESLEIFSSINNVLLSIKSLEYLKLIEEKNNDSQKVKLYAKQINDLKKLVKANEKSNYLSSEIQDLISQRFYLKAKINQLNKEQLQSELLIALQKNSVDSLEFQTERNSLILSQNKSVLSEQKAEIALQKSQKQLFYAFLGILCVFVVFMLVRFRETKKNNHVLALKNNIIQEEREKSEALLLNILPSIIAKELMVNGEAQARQYDMATVFFSDFVGFSKIANEISPEKLVALLDEYFRLFDDVIEKFGLEKIKTIGDSYMCVGGLPEKNTSHPSDVIRAALEIQSILNDRKIEKQKLNQQFFEARIGIHTGPLVAGVVGSKKFAYDIWGDTVNVASRIESNGEAGKVNISQSTFELVENEFSFTSRGVIPIKNIGEIQMFFVDKK